MMPLAYLIVNGEGQICGTCLKTGLRRHYANGCHAADKASVLLAAHCNCHDVHRSARFHKSRAALLYKFAAVKRSLNR
jgi:hypothetical protein